MSKKFRAAAALGSEAEKIDHAVGIDVQAPAEGHKRRCSR
jgi:hypothetical protein